MTHTPGPWTRSAEPCSNEIMALDNGKCLVLRARAYGRTADEIEANATLIAAAPDTLKQLQAVDFAFRALLLRCPLECGQAAKELIDETAAIVAKATNTQQGKE